MKLVITCLAFLTSVTAFAQNGAPTTDEPVEPNCYQKYSAVFEERGAYAVGDSLYEDVIVTVRRGDQADCFYGRVRVTDGVMSRIQIKFEDGTYTDLKKKYRHDTPIKIANGMSEPRVTVDDEIVNVLFIQKIKPKRKEFAKAPDPADLDF